MLKHIKVLVFSLMVVVLSVSSVFAETTSNSNTNPLLKIEQSDLKSTELNPFIVGKNESNQTIIYPNLSLRLFKDHTRLDELLLSKYSMSITDLKHTFEDKEFTESERALMQRSLENTIKKKLENTIENEAMFIAGIITLTCITGAGIFSSNGNESSKGIMIAYGLWSLILVSLLILRYGNYAIVDREAPYDAATILNYILKK